MTLRVTAILLATAISSSAFAADAPKLNLKTKTDKISYSIGIDIGKSFHEQDIPLNEQAFLAGVRDGHLNRPALLTDEEIRDTLVALQSDLLEKQKEQAKKVALENKEEGMKFLTENKKRKDVVTLPSGLQYRVVKEGQGSSPKATDTVTTHYSGKLVDGTEFDSSYKRGEPVKFSVNGVIPGWTEALQLMKPGGKWELFIPADLAYGEQGIPNVIPPNSVLLFEVELLAVDPSQASGAKPTDSKTQKTSAKKQ